MSMYKILACLGMFWGLIAGQEARGQIPNFVLIFADDLGYGDLGCYGSPNINTPHIDQLAAEGIRFSDFYMPVSVCTPSRVSLLTGRYHVRTGLKWPYWILGPGAPDGIAASEITLAEVLKERNYATACIGKWHLGDRQEYLPTRHGFERYFGIPYSNDMIPTVLMRDESIIENPVDQSTLTQRYTEEAIQFINQVKDGPFFLYLPHTFPHIPLYVSDEFKGHSARGLYGDVVEEIDWSVGQILAELSRLGLEQNTLVIFTSDNGPWLEKGADGGSAGILQGGKFTVLEGGVRVPCIARWPGHIPPGQVTSAPAVSMDLFPTIVNLAGGEIPRDRALDGKDIFGLLTGQSNRGGEDFFFYWKEGEIHAVRSGGWKLHFDRSGDPTGLYQLNTDPGELQNLASAHPEEVSRLAGKMKGFHVQGFKDTALNGITLVNYLGNSPAVASLARAVPGVVCYTDRDDTLISIPEAFQGGVMLRSADQDRAYTGNEFLVFSPVEGGTVMVAYDRAAAKIPEWLEGWIRTGELVKIKEESGNLMDFDVYLKNFDGWETVTLGGNRQGGGNGMKSYIAMVDFTGNQSPETLDGAVTASAGGIVEIILQAWDRDGDALTYTIVDLPARGTLSGGTGGDARTYYSPESGFEGTDSFTFQAHDGFLNSGIATVTITVTPAPAPHLVSYWKLDEGQGAAARDTVTHTDGNLLNGPLWSPSVPPGINFPNPYSLEFDGNGAHLDTGIDDALDLTASLSIALWVNRRGNSGTVHLFSKNDHPNQSPWQLALVATTNSLRYYASGSAGDLIDSKDSVPMGWHHVALVRDAGSKQLTFFIDGKPDSGGWQPYDPANVAPNAITAKLGARGDGMSNWFDGWLDDVRIYDRALNTAEIARLASGDLDFNGGMQIPGDCNQDAFMDLSDAICFLWVLFLGTPNRFPCGDGQPGDDGNQALLDWQPDGELDLSDVVAQLQFLFAGGPAHTLADPVRGIEACVLITGCPANPGCFR